MKNTLGEGLDALIPPKIPKFGGTYPDIPSKKESIFLIEIDKIKPNPYQPRREFDRGSLGELADSIREYGILQPLIATKIEKEVPYGQEVEYQLVAGERRLRAAQMLGLTQVPVVIRMPKDQEKLEMSLIENVQRTNLNPLERAWAFKKLASEFNLTQQDIATKVGKSREFVANTVRLLDLPENIQGLLSEEKLTEGHARAILGLKTEDEQKAALEQIMRGALNVRDAEELVRRMRGDTSTGAPLAVNPEAKALEEKLKTALGAEIRLVVRGENNKIIIKFPSFEDLKGFVKRLL